MSLSQGLIILAIVGALIILYFYGVKSSKGRKERALWQECRRKLRLPDKVADETIKRYIKSLQKSHPHHSEEWYLEKIIYDLERDRR